MVRAGVPETVAMSITGHRTRAMFDRYNITGQDDQRDALKQTTEYVTALPARDENVADHAPEKRRRARTRTKHGLSRYKRRGRSEEHPHFLRNFGCGGGI